MSWNKHQNWKEDFSIAKEMLNEAGICIEYNSEFLPPELEGEK